MLELAIAEAYRPRATKIAPPSQPTTPRPASFATNPNAKPSTFSLRLRPPSAPLRPPSTTSQSRSFRSFITRKRPDSVLSDRTIVPHDAARTDSVLRQTTVTPKTHAAGESRKIGREQLPELPELPPPVPLPPREELEDFDGVLHDAIEDLQPSSSLPLERDSVTLTLEYVAHVADIAACVATSWPEFWSMLTHATKLISSVLLISDIAVSNVLVRSLAQVAVRWNEERRRGTVEIARIAGDVFEEVVRARKSVGDRMGEVFARSFCEYREGVQDGQMEGGTRRALRILTLDTSAGVLTILTYALASGADPEVQLSILSPADRLSHPLLTHPRLHVITYSAHAVGTASKNVDILLLEAKCIGSQGDVRCQNGALGTAVYVKTLSPGSKVVVLSGVDNIASAAMELRTPDRDVGIIEEGFELVPAAFVDAYVTEAGVLKVDDLGRLADEAEHLDRCILGEEVS